MKVSICNLTKKYGEKIALDNVSLEIENGVCVILGLNGAGKTTLLRLLTDTLTRTDGKILLDGTDILALGRAYRAMVGYVPQEQAYVGEFTARSYLYYMAELKSIPKKEAKCSIEKLLKQFNLVEAADIKMKKFSSGMRQRAMLCQALLGNPQIIILDEPTVGLDMRERISFKKYIKELSENRIIIYCTHIISDVQSLAEQVILLKGGKLIKVCTISEIENESGDGQDLESAVLRYIL